MLLFSFSDIFYIDATNKQTLEMDLGAITDGNLEQSVDASLRWLTNKHDGHWLLFFDNADDVDLKLKEFIPRCAYGNILVTTRNPALRLLTGKGLDENVTGMDHEDARNLLLELSRVDKTQENEVLAAEIVQVFLSFILIDEKLSNKEYRNSITSHWQCRKRVLSFSAIHHYGTTKNSTNMNATICYNIKRLRIRTHTDQRYMRRGG